MDGSDIRCSMHSDQCEIGERWLSPQELETIGYSPCTCDKVRVGSCNSPFKLQCVVDSESCEDEVDFISSYITKAQGNDCFLCSADVFEDDGGKANDDSKADDDDRKADDDDDRKADDDDGKNDDDDTRSSTTVSQTTFVVTLAFMIFGLVIALVLSLYIVLTSRKSEDNNVDTKSTNGSVV